MHTSAITEAATRCSNSDGCSSSSCGCTNERRNAIRDVIVTFSPPALATLWPMAYGAPCGGSGRYARPAVPHY
eukprot:7084871-Prymnesium_polylepis.2